MANLKMSGVKITMPNAISNFTDTELVKWLEFELGLRDTLSKYNPLSGTKLKDCDFKADKVLWDGEDITDQLPKLTA